MAQSRYLTRRTSVAWAAGTIGTPVSLASYPVLSPSYNVEGAEVIPGLPSVGAHSPHFNRPGGRFATLSFTSECYGQPSNTVPMAWGALLRACSFSEEVVSTNFFAYYGPPFTGATPTTGSAGPHLLSDSAGSLDPIDLTINIDGLANFCNDAVGNVTFRGGAGQITTANFAFTGRVKTGTSQTAAALVGAAQTAYATLVTPRATRAATSTIGGNSVVFFEWEYDLGAIIDIRPDVNGEFGYSAPIITGYNPTARVVFEAPAEATYNPLDAFLSSTSVAVAIADTTPASLSRVTWGWTGYWASLAQIGDRNGKAVYEGTMTQSPLTGPLTITTS